MRESPTTPTRRRWVRRSGRPRPPPAAQDLRQGEAEQPILAARREGGESLGAYETRYDVRRGYATDRTIIRP